MNTTIDPQTNGPQLFYGLRYHQHIVKPGEVETYHDQVGYCLWEPAAGTIILDSSTNTPAMSREVAKAAAAKGIVYLDVRGKWMVNAEGRRMLGSDFDTLTPDQWPARYDVFQADGTTLVYVGTVGPAMNTRFLARCTASVCSLDGRNRT